MCTFPKLCICTSMCTTSRTPDRVPIASCAATNCYGYCTWVVFNGGHCTYRGTGMCFSSLTCLAAPTLNMLHMLRVLAHAPQRMRRAHRQRRHVRAVEYVYGALGSNECPSGSTRITGAAACEAAATAMGNAIGPTLVEREPAQPSGCYWWRTGSEQRVYLNNASPGAGSPGSQLLCGASPCCFTLRCIADTCVQSNRARSHGAEGVLWHAAATTATPTHGPSSAPTLAPSSSPTTPTYARVCMRHIMNAVG